MSINSNINLSNYEKTSNISIQSSKKKYIKEFLIFAIAFVSYIAIFITSHFNTNTGLFFSADEDGNLCGYGGLFDYDKIYFYKLDTDEFNKRVCVSDCPDIFNGFLKCFPTKQNSQCKIENKTFYISKQSIFILTI